MRKMVQKSLLLVAMFGFVASPMATGAEKEVFSDVPSDHWAAEAIAWGVEKHVVNGYGDGSFAPERPVTEAEFLKILISSYETLPPGGENWFDAYYGYAYKKGWYVRGLKQQKAADLPILRRGAAILLASALGQTFKDDNDESTAAAIDELYRRELSKGKTEKTFVGFAPDEPLTRAEAVQFIQNFVMSSGIDQLKTVIPESDWAIYRDVYFTELDRVLEKHKLFAKQYDLKVSTYQTDGTTIIELSEGPEIFLISRIKLGEEETIEWLLVSDLEIANRDLAYDLTARMFEYDSELTDWFSDEIVPYVQHLESLGYSEMRTAFGNLNFSTQVNKDTSEYILQTVIGTGDHP